MKIAETEKDILNDLRELEDTISQYTFLIGCAGECLPFPEEYRTDEYLIRECLVKTWVYAGWEDERCVFLADSESLIVKGALSLLQELYAGRSRMEIAGYHCGLLDEEIFCQHFTGEQIAGLRVILKKLCS